MLYYIACATTHRLYKVADSDGSSMYSYLLIALD